MKNTENIEKLKHQYLKDFIAFEQSLNGFGGKAIHQVRKQAIEKFSALGFPTTRNEEWKYTSPEPVLGQKFVTRAADNRLSTDQINPFLFAKSAENRLVFVNGVYQETLSTPKSDIPGLIISNFAAAVNNHEDLVAQYLGKYASCDNETFVALNTGFMQEGVFIYVPENVVVEQPIHILHLAHPQAEDLAVHHRTLIVVGKGSRLKLIERYHGNGENVYFNNVVSEFVVGENAHLDHIKIQKEGSRAFHFSFAQFHQERNSVVSTVNIDLGGALVRNNLNVLLNASNCETHLFGLFMGEKKQHFDNRTFIDHAKPHCFSNELYKGILNDKAHGVFNGKILVRPDAQKTNALQSNKTLLLTDDAVINAKPQLEIFADDVKCTHGATIGQLDDEALFYLQARGIGEEMAKAMLRHAFVADVLDNVREEEVRNWLDKEVIARFTTRK